MNIYQKNKERARQTAIAWQHESANTWQTWAELAEASAYFETLGKRYGLIKEFRENGII